MAPASKPATILVVDDDHGLLRLMEKTLRREGYEVAVAATGREAISWLENNRADLLVLDLKLQDIEGCEVIGHLDSVGRSTPFVIITGQGDERVAVEMMRRGALDYLVKNLRFQEFVPTVVERALKQVERQQQLAAAESALKRESAFNQTIFNTSGAALMVLDSDFRIVRFNHACELLSGYSFEEVKGQKVSDFLLLSTETDLVNNLLDELRAWAPALQSENHWRTKGGELRTIAWTHTALRDAQGRLEFILSSGLDITERRRLEKEILQISDLEQRRIGQDLHDGLCQHLAGIEFMSQALSQSLPPKSKGAIGTGEIGRLIREAITHTRDLAHGLSPVVLESQGLMFALQELAETTSKRFKVKCRFLCKSPVLIIDNAVATHLYRIAQEAVSNALRHGQARRVEISLTRTPERVALAIHDDGRGFEQKPDGHRGMGLHIMQYRAGVRGGSVAIQRDESGGTSVICTVHLPTANESNGKER